MDANKVFTQELIQLRDALSKVKQNTERFSSEAQKSQDSFAKLSNSLSELSALQRIKVR